MQVRWFHFSVETARQICGSTFATVKNDVKDWRRNVQETHIDEGPVGRIWALQKVWVPAALAKKHHIC
jgi:hypothetical protein